MQANKNWEAGFAGIGSTLELKSDGRADLGWLASLSIVKAGSNFKFSAVFFNALDGTEHIVTPTGTFVMSDYFSLSVFKSFYFEKREATAAFVLRLGVLDHDAFALALADLIHELLHLFFGFADSLLAELHDIVGAFVELGLANSQPFFEVSFYERGVEDHELDLCPLRVLCVVLSHDAHNLLEVVAARPEFPIEGHLRQLVFPLLGGVERVSISCEHAGAVPVAANTVKLFAH